ncbi:MAG: hypothetical protein ACRDTT_35700 [Pseudonocardiaceae bacterium]
MTTSPDRPASTSPTTDERRPGCDQADGVRWYYRTAGLDTLGCTDCGHDWAISSTSRPPTPPSKVP